MTYEEKIEMYKGKKAFIKRISEAFSVHPRVSSVTEVDYEVYHRQVTIDGELRDHFVEYVIVRFFGGGKSVKFVSGNSCTANFRVLGTMVEGGYYDENREYEALTEKGFTLLPLEIGTVRKLDQLLSKPLTHISDVRRCFNYCTNGKDVAAVIKLIPAMFGTFDVEFGADGETFTITNVWYADGEQCEEETEFEFYEEEESV